MKKLVSIRCLPLQIFVLAFIFSFVVTSIAYSSESKQAKKILIIHSDVPEMSYVKLLHKGIFDFFASDKGADVEYFIEYMEAGRYRTPEFETKLSEMYSLKYSTNRPDLIIAVSYQALKFITDYGRELFPGVPVIFTLIIDHELDELTIDNDMITGIYTEMGFEKTLEAMQRVQPDLERIVVITGSSPYDIFWRKKIVKDFSAYKGDVEFEYLHDLSMDELKERISQYRKGTAVYYFMMLEDGAGNKYQPWMALTLFAPSSGVPVFSSFDSLMGYGTVGGYQLSIELYGKLTAETAQRVLEGEAPSNIPIIKYTDWPYIFDWRELKRWNIDERDLPEGSIVRYKEWSFWDLYRWYIIGGIFLMLFEGFIIFNLFIQRKKAEQNAQSFRISDLRYQAFVKNSTEVIWCVEFEQPIDIDMPEDEQLDRFFKYGYLSETNDAYARSVGLENAEELMGMRIEEFAPRSVPENVATVKALVRGRYTITGAESVESFKEGVKRVWLNNAFGIIEAGHVVRVWGTGIDITDRKALEDKLVKAEQMYRTVADFTYDWETWESPERRMEYVSPSCARIAGYRPEEFMDDPGLMQEIILPDDRDRWDEHRTNSMKSSSAQEIQLRIRKKDGEIRWIEHVCQPVHDVDGKFLGVRASNRDITWRKLTEKDLEAKEKMLEEAQSIARLVSWDWNIIKNELAWSDEVYRIFGLSPQEFGATYEAFLERIHPHDLKNVKDAVNRALADPSSEYNIMHRIVTPEGIELMVRGRGNVTFDDKGKATHMIGTVQDITDIKIMEAETQKLRSELAHMDRSGMMGVLTAGIAHEINQPLAAILSNAQAALRFLTGDRPDLDEVREALKDIISDDKRAGEVVHSIRNIMGRSELKKEEIDFNETIREVLVLIKSEVLNRKILLSESLQPDIPKIYGHHIQIQQVILNLLMNALEALDENRGTTSEIFLSSRVDENQCVVLSVSDSGPGIKPDLLVSIFDSFYTTKAGGMGVGLSICRSIIEDYGGTIWAENRPEGGAVFFFKLPFGKNRDE
jgi:PAS domain S-box-containing protein